MRLTSTSDTFRTQIKNPKVKSIPFKDRFRMLMDLEYSNRESIYSLLNISIPYGFSRIFTGTPLLFRTIKHCYYIWIFNFCNKTACCISIIFFIRFIIF